ncbi:MAG: YciI family protein [Gemmatimonadota bacterium]|nr:YciI family protein [Gemmatimonadota bacterium]
MKYLCLIYADETLRQYTTPEQQAGVSAQYRTFTEGIKSSGHLLGGEALRTSDLAKTVRTSGGSTSTTDGPYAETKEQLGGFYLVEARDLNEVIQLAAGIPGAKFGSIEVRPVAEKE